MIEERDWAEDQPVEPDNICRECDGTGADEDGHLCKGCQGKGYVSNTLK